jgi:putative ABC transport system permease protein
MKTIFRIFSSSSVQAFQQLWGNKLRTSLSLLGIMIGIFCIIGVLAAVDSLEDNVKGSFEKLGEDVLYLQKFSWASDPGQNWFRYLRRPNVDYDDFKAIKGKSRLAGKVAFQVYLGTKTAKFRSSSVENFNLIAISNEFDDVFKLNIIKGRFFSPSEFHFGANKVVLGGALAEGLFGSGIDPIGKIVKIGGRDIEVVGVLEKEGESLISINNYDEVALIPYEYGRKISNLKSNSPFGNSTIAIKAKEGVSVQGLLDELTGILRAHRRLAPLEEDDFSLNELSLLTKILDGFFGVLNGLGIIIGGFAMFVGMFSVANIMFVSVKERTSIIGVKKALGAKKFVILTEFLIESVMLCLVGGIIGLGLTFLAVTLLSGIIEFDLHLSVENIITGISVSVVVGIISGFIPALQASNMDPVEAIRK